MIQCYQTGANKYIKGTEYAAQTQSKVDMEFSNTLNTPFHRMGEDEEAVLIGNSTIGCLFQRELS